MEFISTKLCFVKDVGLNGNLFGGNMLAWMDEIAAIYAMKKTKEQNLVTFRFGEIRFNHPVKVNDIVDFYGEVTHRGKTSISFNLVAQVNSYVVFITDCTFVALDTEGNKKLINWE